MSFLFRRRQFKISDQAVPDGAARASAVFTGSSAHAFIGDISAIGENTGEVQLEVSLCRLLAVDDDSHIRESRSFIIDQLGHAVMTPVDGETAFGARPEFAPDLVRIDVGLPEMRTMRSRRWCAPRRGAGLRFGWR